MKSRQGFTLMELLVVATIIAFLAALAMPSLMRFMAKSKRSEAYLTLRSLYVAQKAYHMEHGSYTTALLGEKSLGWKPEGALLYTYGFPGSEGSTCIVGTLKAPPSALQGAMANDTAFVIAAAADIDGDGVVDVVTIDHTGAMKVLVDDCAS